MNITTWFSENKLASFLAAVFLIGTAGLGWLAWSAWDDYGEASDKYASKASAIDHLAHNTIFPSASNLRKLGETVQQSQADLDKLRVALRHYSIPSLSGIQKTKPQDQPQYFQDDLRNQVTAIKTLAGTSGSTLPPSFYLGLDDYENHLPQPDQVPGLSKQLTVLTWLARKVVAQKGVIVAEFARILPPPSQSKPLLDNKKPPSTTANSSQKGAAPSVPLPAPYETLVITRITLRCGQGALRELINEISSAPYFLIIEDIKIQNSVTEPPRKDAAPQSAEQSPNGSTPVQRLPIIVGRESLNASLRIRTLDFPAPQKQPETSK